MDFLIREPINDVRAGALEPLRPFDVILFVKTRFELDDNGDLFLVFGRGEQRANDRRVLARSPIERRFDRENLWIFGRLLHELDHRIERLVGMVQHDVAFANLREDVRRADEPLGNRRHERLVAQTLVTRQIHDLPKVAQRHEAFDLVAVDVLELE